MPKKTLNDRALGALKPAPKGGRYEVLDTVVPGLIVRVTDTGSRTFMLKTRFPGSKHPTRRALGAVGAVDLVKVRDKARAWLDLIGKGLDPAHVEERQRVAELQKQADTFAAVAEAFIAKKLPVERKGGEVERDIRRDLLPPWGHRPIGDITRRDVKVLIEAKAATAPAQARNLLGTVKRIFAWAVDQETLATSPAESLKPSKIDGIGEKKSGERILTDDELRAFWRAVSRMPYPFGPLYRLLALTGLRLNEAADAQWSEFAPEIVRAIDSRKEDEAIDWSAIDLKFLIWTIPAARMKGKNSKARPHVVPLTADMLAVLADLPRFNSGDFLFSTTFGVRPVWVSDKAKKRLDRRMARTLRALAVTRGEDHRKVTLAPWINHDLRRTLRSGLSQLRIDDDAAEAVLAHVKTGIVGVYDRYKMLPEKRHAHESWGSHLRSIVEPMPSNVVKLATTRG